MSYCLTTYGFYDEPVPFMPYSLPETPLEVRADYFGGYEIYNPNSLERTEIRPDGINGYTFYDSKSQRMRSIRPDNFGGYKVY
jgi:hypothetical protein